MYSRLSYITGSRSSAARSTIVWRWLDEEKGPTSSRAPWTPAETAWRITASADSGPGRSDIHEIDSKRPSGRRAAEQREELAPLHSITSSARASRAVSADFWVAT